MVGRVLYNTPHAFFLIAFAIFVPLVSRLTEINKYVIIFKVNSQQSQKCPVTAITQHAFTMRSVGVTHRQYHRLRHHFLLDIIEKIYDFATSREKIFAGKC